MLKWKIGGAFTHSSEKMSSPSTTKSTKNNAQDPSSTTTTTKSSSPSITSTLSATTITSAAQSPSNSTRSSCSSSSSSTINTRRGGGPSSSDSSGPNKSFLHQSFVTGSCPSDEYYDGSRLSTLARKHQFERQLSTRSVGSVESYATLTPVKEFLQDLEDSDEDSLEETEASGTKDVMAAILVDHYSMPMNNTLVSTLPSEPTTNPTTNLTLNPASNFTLNPATNLTPNPTPNPTTNPTP
ncbi:hypothetical protein Pcinc_015757, partial [Petrolisthes cinctipes]